MPGIGSFPEDDPRPDAFHRDPWNRCEVCGRFIPYADFDSGAARHTLLTPDSHLTSEEWETLCKVHNERPAAPA